MSTQAKALAEASTTPAVAPQRRKFTVAEYYRMAEAGILGPDERADAK